MPEHKCTECGKVFRDLSHLTRHMPKHTGEKAFKCEICGKTLTYRKSYARHIASHTGVKEREKCHICQMDFSTKGNLKRHMENHNRTLPYKCDTCGKEFNRLDNFKRHERICHTGAQSPYKCDVCSTTFTRLSIFNKHIQKYHKESQHSDQVCSSRPSTTVSLQVDPLVGEVVSTTQIVESFNQTITISDVWSREGNVHVEITRSHDLPPVTVTSVTSGAGGSFSSVDCGFSGSNSDLGPQESSSMSVKDVFMGNERVDMTLMPLTTEASETGKEVSSIDHSFPDLNNPDYLDDYPEDLLDII